MFLGEPHSPLVDVVAEVLAGEACKSVQNIFVLDNASLGGSGTATKTDVSVSYTRIEATWVASRLDDLGR